MGMLMHRTWEEQQKKAKEQKPAEEPREEKSVETAEPARRSAGRRKANKD